MPRPLNIVLLVIDSLRYDALGGGGAQLPFFDRLAAETVCFRRAYASECWTLPSHMSMFTGLLPSEHGAHFGSMAYDGAAPTIAEVLGAAGYATELITRNPVFDGLLPGVTRGFQRNRRVLADLRGLNPLAIILALSKPRFRRQIASSGFFHPLQRTSRQFVAAFARSTVPADAAALDAVLQCLRAARGAAQPCFVFANLFDVHAPYPPSPHSIFRAPTTRDAWLDLLLMPSVLPKLGSHRYLQPGFSLSPLKQRLLRQRYADAVRLMDQKLVVFHAAASAEGLLDDALLIVTSDHGEAFGEHALYLHDASVYDVHLHVPLFVAHPALSAATIDDVVTTRDLFGVMRAVGLGKGFEQTLLSADYRGGNSVAFAEHTPYPHLGDVRPQYRERLAAAISGTRKLILRGGQAEWFDLAADPGEDRPATMSLGARLGAGAEGAAALALTTARDGLPPAR